MLYVQGWWMWGRWNKRVRWWEPTQWWEATHRPATHSTFHLSILSSWHLHMGRKLSVSSSRYSRLQLVKSAIFFISLCHSLIISCSYWLYAKGYNNHNNSYYNKQPGTSQFWASCRWSLGRISVSDHTFLSKLGRKLAVLSDGDREISFWFHRLSVLIPVSYTHLTLPTILRV